MEFQHIVFDALECAIVVNVCLRLDGLRHQGMVPEVVCRLLKESGFAH